MKEKSELDSPTASLTRAVHMLPKSAWDAKGETCFSVGISVFTVNLFN